ncbi:MAG: hypothetical protein K2P21_11420 [Lachnospiraceae bacterium]|nr:hypothetical protein [Lachnospiraceae bacterium]
MVADNMAYGSGQRGRMLNFVESKCYIDRQLEHLYNQTPVDAAGKENKC